MEDHNQIIKKYINTPFAYARAQKGLTLLQQNIMVKVVEHLQVYINKYFKNPSLRGAKEDPKPIMTCEDRDKLPPIRIELSELCIASSSYSRVREALKEVMNVQIEKNTFDTNGKPVKRLMQIFSKIDTPVTDKGTQVRMKLGENEELTDVQVDRTRGYIDIYLNTDMVFEMFDMNHGYVSHPEDIARIGKVDNMPLMYYLVRHKMRNFDWSKAEITPFEIRDYLGLIKRDADGNVTDVKYPRYSMFKARIIKTALDDIKRVCDAGQIDFYFDMEEVRPRGKKTGEPSYLIFRKVGVKKSDGGKKRKAGPQQQSFAFDVYEHVDKTPKPKETYTSEYVKEWQEFMCGYDGPLKDILSRGKVLGKGSNGWLVLEFEKTDIDSLNASEEWTAIRDDFKKRLGRKYGPGVQIKSK